MSNFETIEAYLLGAAGLVVGVYELFIKEPIARALGELAVRRNQ